MMCHVWGRLIAQERALQSLLLPMPAQSAVSLWELRLRQTKAIRRTITEPSSSS